MPLSARTTSRSGGSGSAHRTFFTRRVPTRSSRVLPQHDHGQHRGSSGSGPNLRGDGRDARHAGLGDVGPHPRPSHAIARRLGHRRRLRLGRGIQPLGRHAMGRSLDNTLRIVQVRPTEWVLCDIRMHALVGGYARESPSYERTRELLATASRRSACGCRLTTTSCRINQAR